MRILKHCSALREGLEHFLSEWPLGIGCRPIQLAQVMQIHSAHRVPGWWSKGFSAALPVTLGYTTYHQ